MKMVGNASLLISIHYYAIANIHTIFQWRLLLQVAQRLLQRVSCENVKLDSSKEALFDVFLQLLLVRLHFQVNARPTFQILTVREI
jgi:hypothetical protein